MKTNILLISLLSCIVLLSAKYTHGEINWQTISSGGTDGSSTNFQLMGTAGQTAVGTSSSANYDLDHGYWQDFGRQYLCGDADGNDVINISDAVYMISYIFGGASPPDPLLSADCDCNEIVNISDVVYLIAYIFAGGPVPCAECP